MDDASLGAGDVPLGPAEPPPGETAGELDGRFTLVRAGGGEGAPSFADDVVAGLTAEPKYLQPKYFYDELGSLLFEAICLTPEYYPTRSEAEVLSRHADEISAVLGGRVRLVELGSGSSVKTRYLIEALLRRQGALHYMPIDISESAVARSAQELLGSYPGLTVTAAAADYHHALEQLVPAVQEGDCGDEAEASRTLVLFLGSTIGNLEEKAARRLLSEIHHALCPGDGLLLGADLRKHPSVLLAAYDDSLGVTAAFNRNILVRINRELGAGFDVDRFRHQARWNEAKSRVEMHLESLEDQTVSLGEGRPRVSLRAGETIHTENSHKYDLAELGAVAEDAGFRLEKSWFDARRRFSVNLLIAG